MAPEDRKNFKHLINDIYNAVYILITKDKEEEGLEILADMIDSD
jgi:hypothetical protein